MIATGESRVPSRTVGMPCSKPIVWREGSRGASKAFFDSTQAFSGMLASEVNVSWPPIVTPHRPRLTE